MRIFLIAGEPSGDRLGAALMAGLKQLRDDIEFIGVSGPLMQAEGMNSLFPMDELSVMGLAEILPKYKTLKARVKQSVAEVLRLKPDVLITIDSPDFCLRVAKLVKAESDISTVHYVAPSVWAWRAGRAAKMAKFIDHVLALLPFEPPYMQNAGMTCDFVGHPVVAEPIVTKSQIQSFKKTHGLGTAPVILVLPGSRRAEVECLSPVFGAALQDVIHNIPNARIVVPAARSVATLVKQSIKDWPGDPIIVNPSELDTDIAETNKRIAFATADVALAASGTVSLELAAACVPMVIAYKVQWLTYQIMSRMIKVNTVTLVNLVTGNNVVPEYIGPDCQPEPIAASLIGLLQDNDLRGEQIAAMIKTMDALGRGSEAPGLRAARSVLAAI